MTMEVRNIHVGPPANRSTSEENAPAKLPAASKARNEPEPHNQAESHFQHSCAMPVPAFEAQRALDAGAPAYFRPYTQVRDAMFALEAKYPGLVKVEDVGDSGEKRRGKADRDILAFRIASPKPGEPRKPILFVIAGEHAREIANPEIAMRWSSNLAAGYGKDAKVTAALDRCEVVVIPMVNPDGHAVVEEGYATGDRSKLMQRKTTTATGAPPQHIEAGTDPNRNYPFRWGGPGASTSPSSETFRGFSAGSEPEIQAVVQLAEKLGLGKDDFFISLHSYSELVLYPWGDTAEPTPHHAHFVAIGEAMASLTDEGGDRYTPQQAVELYPTSGTSDDHMYGAHGTAGVTLETGETFHQTDAQFDETWKEVEPTLDYALALTGAPYSLPHGPMVRSVEVASNQVTARVSDGYNGKQNVVAAEAVSDPATPPGQGVPLSTKDGGFNAPEEVVTGDIASLQGDKVFVRARDEQGNWGPTGVAWSEPKQA